MTTNIIDGGNKTVELFDDKELSSFGDYLPDIHYNGILVPKANMTSEDIVSFFKEFGVEVSIMDDLEDWNCTFENCSLCEVSYGNGLLGDGSIAPSISLMFCDKPNEYWRGH